MAATEAESPDRDHDVDGPPSRRPTERASLVVIGVVALLGLAWRVAYTIRQFDGDDYLVDEGDAFVYSPTALNTAKGHWFVNPFDGSHFADHPPMTVLALTPTGWLFPDSSMAQRITHCVFGALAVVVIGLVARRLAGSVAGGQAGGAGRIAGPVAAVVAAVNPNLWMNDAVIMSESVSTLLIALLVWAAVATRATPTWAGVAGTGALCGLTILARAEIGLFLPFLLAPALLLGPTGTPRPAWADRREWAVRAGRVAVAGACAAAVVAPWTIWNTVKFEEPVLLSTNDGTTLLGANCPRTYGTHTVGSWSIQCILDFNEAEGTREQGLDASQVSVLQREEAIRYARENAGDMPKVVFARLGRTFGWWEIGQQVYINQGEGRPEWASWLGYWTFWALTPVAAAGAVVLRRRGGDLLPAAAALATVVAVSVLFYGIGRFRLPLDVMTCVLAGVAAAAAWERWGRGLRARSGPPSDDAARRAPAP